LRGELTSRFLLKVLVVLALSGGVFFYYFGGLRKTGDADSRRRRDRWMTLVSSLAVVLLAMAGFTNLGAPRRQREMRADGQRIMRLYQMSGMVEGYWKTHDSTLPADVGQLTGSYLDPVTRRPLTYRPEQGSRYELCANFARSSDGSVDTDAATGADVWVHPAGQHCFELDASVPAGYPTGYVNY
ncbi:MAG TPA: hypothetical protein VHE33_08435, partial [Acidobacteriaceae bacterium]|nr:hypothetical protein [Acidobacteriaceae bacterium]